MSFPAAGSIYVIRTVLPISIAAASVKTTVDPETTAVETVALAPLEVIAKADVAAVVALSASL